MACLRSAEAFLQPPCLLHLLLNLLLQRLLQVGGASGQPTTRAANDAPSTHLIAVDRPSRQRDGKQGGKLRLLLLQGFEVGSDGGLQRFKGLGVCGQCLGFGLDGL